MGGPMSVLPTAAPLLFESYSASWTTSPLPRPVRSKACPTELLS